MTKRISEQLEKFTAKNKEIHFTLGTLVVMCLSVIAMIVATFILLKLPNSQEFMTFLEAPDLFIKNKLYLNCSLEYIPQIPILLFICVILGRKYTLITTIIYILIGLFLIPIFSFGGGIKYVLQYNFGYILAYIPAIIATTFFIKKERKILTCFWAVLSAVFIIHFIGSIYLTLIAMVKNDTFNLTWALISQLTTGRILYDLILGYIAVMLARPTKGLLWLAMG